MRLAFLHCGVSEDLAKVMIASVRQHMPNVIVTQLTDERSRKVQGVDEIRRVSGRMYPYLLCKHLAELPTPFIRVDYDMVFQGDITHILDGDYDLAANLHGDQKINDSEWGQAYPYATSVLGCNRRGTEFAEDFRKTHMESGRDDWMGLIPSVNDVISSGRYKVRPLPGFIYNYTPKDKDDRPPGALVLHYKGLRKKWMIGEGREHLVKRDEFLLNERIKACKELVP